MIDSSTSNKILLPPYPSFLPVIFVCYTSEIDERCDASCCVYTRGREIGEADFFRLLVVVRHKRQAAQASGGRNCEQSFFSPPPSSSFDHCLPPIPKLSPEERKVCDTGEGEGGGFLELEFRQEGGRAAECSSICL